MDKSFLEGKLNRLRGDIHRIANAAVPVIRVLENLETLALAQGKQIPENTVLMRGPDETGFVTIEHVRELRESVKAAFEARLIVTKPGGAA